ncbi:hypothetical protein BURPS1106B_A3296 [Burkholderia pseudomallei 1106b]|uniref:Uncharacterized protein n=2 Tax=Burkholderia pseudomallei TaxID=28450 RepID=A0A0E1W0Z4_BURPE|nr:hypothetical protein BURPS668_0011 [Burkholderia pseudomallei 668]ABN91099.1 hypothetical protein BURPS1106A_0011 [Burkholderia pseudomallei 1106a]ACQ97052.1 conserved hypothetical protein [Burkholderia pseudomallei MSHR346]EBA47102.1 hypothetical protein BURPS305_3077 [Burkholderia pseudomallei 305]EEC33157.1 conserved hypothetical protein [Burkholderia pseudomallei 576]EEH30709.1 conserved hypothetical protein [Burkholderia pseudomallei Pakistan 9]EES27547.1 hypothetical protein BURPS110
MRAIVRMNVKFALSGSPEQVAPYNAASRRAARAARAIHSPLIF